MAAEIQGAGAKAPRPARGFNEAAANGRGNSSPLPGRRGVRRASMRPRRMAAEICPPRPGAPGKNALQ